MKQFFYVQFWKVLIAKWKPDDNKSENRRVTSNPLRCIKRQQQPTPYPKTTATPRTKAKHQLSRKFACRPSVRPSVCPFVSKLLTFHLLLKNHWINFIQTWHKAFLSENDSGFFKTKAMSFSKGRKLQKSKNTWTKFFCRTTGPISTKLDTSILWWRGFKFVQMKGLALYQGR